MLLKKVMLDSDKKRQYVIDMVKSPMIKLIIKVGNRYPEPTRENCTYPNSAILFDIWDEFRERDRSDKLRTAMFDTFFRILICEYEHDPYYRLRIDWCLMRIINSNWIFRYREPFTHWKGEHKVVVINGNNN